VLRRRVVVREIAARDDQFGPQLRDERPQVVLHLGLLLRPGMDVGHLQEA